jgi:hypothetical protein
VRIASILAIYIGFNNQQGFIVTLGVMMILLSIPTGRS